MEKKTLAYSVLDKKNIFSIRQSNQTLLVKVGKLIDSDEAILEDKYGYRYGRRLDFEPFAPGYQVFMMI